MDFSVYKSDDGRIFVQSKYDNFVASFKHGEWVNERMFAPFELQEIPQVEDTQEALTIVREAKRALQQW